MVENHSLKQRNGSEQMDLIGVALDGANQDEYSPTNLEAGLGGGDGTSGTVHGYECFVEGGG